ncbi:MAG TPA: preprotein translocase subunit SecE [Dissulfurispiraceae bacterium]|jgi:preprotein translocase subunit SecE|nr:preprotein translocase subunit SecE [Dissulfurispiraceae bacterium]
MLDRVKNFVEEVKIEAKKVNYPARDELVGSTWVVIATVVVVSLFLGTVDLALAKIVRMLVH